MSEAIVRRALKLVQVADSPVYLFTLRASEVFRVAELSPRGRLLLPGPEPPERVGRPLQGAFCIAATPEEGEGPSSQVERPRRLQLVLPRLGERGLRPSQGGVGGTFEQRETASLLEDVGEVRR